MELKRFTKFLRNRTGMSREELEQRVADMKEDGLDKAQIFNDLVSGTGENNHGSSPRKQEPVRQISPQFYEAES